jgi:uncharacterized protein involved in exopolysaccharide biosynthesis
MTSEMMRSSTPGPERNAPAEQLSMLGVANVVLRNRRLVLAITLLVSIAAIARALLAPRVYASSATLIPAGKKGASAVSGLAAQFGISVPGGDVQQSPDFLVALLRSRTVLEDVLNARYSFTTVDGPFAGTLVDYYGRDVEQPARRRRVARRILDNQLSTATSVKTGAVMFTVKTRSPKLSADIARNLLASLDSFNRARWQAQSEREKEFTEIQLAAAASDLRVAEDRLVAFQEQNRDYARAPRLRSQYERMVRESGMRQALYTSLTQAYAQARMDAVRDNPSVTVIESPDVPPDPEPRGLLQTGVVALMAGLFLGVFLAFMREHFTRTRRLNPDEEQEYALLRADTMRDLRNPLRLLRNNRG